MSRNSTISTISTLTSKSRVRSLATAVVLASALTAGTAAIAASPAAAAPQSSATVQAACKQQSGYWYCGYDNRKTPPTIKKGAKGNTVKEAQALLLSLGYSVGSSGVDGDFGAATHNAVVKFQKDFKVAGGADGIVGANTWKALRTV
ncbi:peptidoglycan-binding domain-containing protein [Streptomyces sp. NBC_01429]|uniref:peptidoglycan-binding domain-containing protein n=1 Tax=Streptomyces sp. NBC_01429 TaxID=2903862 RepID=UPI002E27FB91|nr:peptidoglycan-binding domain-containing protein [Streptomyces sp. NBC_01429]